MGKKLRLIFVYANISCIRCTRKPTSNLILGRQLKNGCVCEVCAADYDMHLVPYVNNPY